MLIVKRIMRKAFLKELDGLWLNYYGLFALKGSPKTAIPAFYETWATKMPVKSGKFIEQSSLNGFWLHAADSHVFESLNGCHVYTFEADGWRYYVVANTIKIIGDTYAVAIFGKKLYRGG